MPPNATEDVQCVPNGRSLQLPMKGRKARAHQQGKDDNPSSSYRPLCMLDTAGKVFEKLIKSLLHAAAERAGVLSKHQYGFRSG